MSHETPARAMAGDIDRRLHQSRDPARAVAEKRYLKSDLEFLGTGVPAVRAIVKATRRTYPALDHGTLLELVQLLWSRPVHERHLAAVEVLAAYTNVLERDDIVLIERLIREAGTWALVDPLATGIVAALVQRDRDLTGTLDRWATDTDFWVRRAALLALLPPLRAGEGDFDRFSRYADGMLEEREFFVRKAIGWILREVGKKRPDLVYDWLLPRAARASGVTVREAVRYLPPDQRAAVLRVYQGHAGLP